MEAISKIIAPKTMVGTAKKKGIAVRWSMPNGLHGMIYPSGQVIVFALEKERNLAVESYKKPEAKVTLSNEEEYKLKRIHRQQEIAPVVASNVRKVLSGKHWATR